MNILVHYRKWTRMDYLEEISPEPTPLPRRRTHSPAFKSHLVALCKNSAVSVAAIARAHNINDNMLHRWIKEANVNSASPPLCQDSCHCFHRSFPACNTNGVTLVGRCCCAFHKS
ncbi:transposase [Advenella sp. WQ 585]|uniref:Transposase n=1 Tax=Advenella mandrilli TaxID=2800330 RepID=A0ABS1EI33_9BURK|nr:transposase [Advenella mandrilli]